MINRLPFIIYYCCILLLGAFLSAYLVITNLDFGSLNIFHIVVFSLLIVLTDSITIQRQADKGSKVSSSQAFDLSVVVIFGPSVAVLIVPFLTMFRGVFLEKTSLKKAIFNAAMVAIACSLAGLTFQAMPWNINATDIRFLIPLLMSFAVYSLVNTLLVAFIVKLDAGKTLKEIWHHDFEWGIFISILLEPAWLATIVFLYYDIGIWSLIISVPPIYMLNVVIKSKIQPRKEHFALLELVVDRLESHETYTYNHSYRVAHYSIIVGKELHLSQEELDILKDGALIHDIGKIKMPLDLLRKPGKLTTAEFDTLSLHPGLGADIVSEFNQSPEVIDLIKHHHERPDGKGYPDKLSEKDISLGASIVNVADAFDAMTSDRSYRKALPVEAAISELEKYSGTQFNFKIVDVFVKLVKEGKINPYTADEDCKDLIKKVQSRGIKFSKPTYAIKEDSNEIH